MPRVPLACASSLLHPSRRRARGHIVQSASAALNVVLFATLGGLALASGYFQDLPDHRWLGGYDAPQTTRVYAADGTLVAEYARENRIWVRLDAIPDRVIAAFLAAEDKNFFGHPGIDPLAILRAAAVDLRRLGTGRRPIGASTITQQVARHFMLSNEVSLARKLREALLAWRLEATLGKRGVLELYLNEIYLGRGAYGVAAAARTYFGKALDELGVAEAAFLAALPKAPAHYDPRRHPRAAKARRDWVIGEMADAGFIGRDAAAATRAAALGLDPPAALPRPSQSAFAEAVRRDLARRLGSEMLYTGGLSVRTTLDPRLQAIAQRALRRGLEAYDRRHGWRGPLDRLPAAALATPKAWRKALAPRAAPTLPPSWTRAVVLGVADGAARIGLPDGRRGWIPLAEIAWARPHRPGQRLGPKVTRVGDVLREGDVVAVAPAAPAARHPGPPRVYALRQVPDVDGAVVVLEPHTGRVLALSGGYRFRRGVDEFNRATQARRQPGSAFKPFVYLAALEAGYTPASVFRDTPIALPLGRGRGLWRPRNYAGRYLGPRPLRVGLEQSRNVMTVRVARRVGMARVAAVAERFGITERMPRQLAQALGAGETTLIRLTAAYGMLANGGHRIAPRLIERVQDRRGATRLRRDDRRCPACAGVSWTGQAPPEPADARTRVADPVRAYQLVSMLQGVVARGTGRRLRSLGRPVAGKTGTTNDSKDAWFIGFTPGLVVGAYVGFDTPRTLGRRETGARVAAPIVEDVLSEALAGAPARPFPVPAGVRFARVRLADGRRAGPDDDDVVLEAFKAGHAPSVSTDRAPRRQAPSPAPTPPARRQQTARVPTLGPLY